VNKETIYDYVITSVSNPKFEDNINLMTINIIEAGGTCPTFKERYKNGDKIPGTDPIEYIQIPIIGTDPMYGSKAANGKIQLHFRLREKFSESELKDFLETDMGNPKPPITVSSIRSGFKTVYVDDGQDDDGNPLGHYDYDVVMQANKATFLPFMNDVQDGVDGNGDPIMRPPNVNDDLYLSGYFGSEPIELV